MSFSHDNPARSTNALARRTAFSASKSLGLFVRLRILMKRGLSNIDIATEAFFLVSLVHGWYSANAQVLTLIPMHQ
jgi:hypothetical protein